MRTMVVSLSVALAAAAVGYSQPDLRIALPERTRLLEDQRLDLAIEVRNATGVRDLRVLANGQDLTSRFTGRAANLDCDDTADAVYLAEWQGFSQTSVVRLEVTANSAAGPLRDAKDIRIQPFRLANPPRNVILFIGDGMAEAYRDAGRIVARSVETVPGVPGLREGFFDRLLEMDSMPISGMAIGHGMDKVIPDSANSASALSTGNRTTDGAFGVFPDGNDCEWMKPGANLANSAAFLDNPRIETLAEYVKRRFGYRMGLVTTSAVTDATPAAQASHMAERDAAFEVARQYLENPVLNGPAVDVLLGGGRESFEASIRADGRDLIAEFREKGYRFVETEPEMEQLDRSAGRVLGLFKRASGVSRHASGIRPSSAGHMNVAYDKLGLTRPGSEPLPDFGVWKQQPFLEDMTRKAIEILAGPGRNQPFFLMIEGASIDKQSHSAHAAGTIWDVIEFDKAIGIGRAWARLRKPADTLLVVTADHGQTMSILGVHEISDEDLSDRGGSLSMSVTSPVGTHSTRIYKDVNTNVRPMLPYGSSGSSRTGPPAERYGAIYDALGFPDYLDANGDGYPENRELSGKGRRRLSVGFRTGSHAFLSLPVSAEGPGAFLFTGYMDQTDIPLKIAATLGSDTAEGDRFVNEVLLSDRYPKTFGK